MRVTASGQHFDLNDVVSIGGNGVVWVLRMANGDVMTLNAEQWFWASVLLEV